MQHVRTIKTQQMRLLCMPMHLLKWIYWIQNLARLSPCIQYIIICIRSLCHDSAVHRKLILTNFTNIIVLGCLLRPTAALKESPAEPTPASDRRLYEAGSLNEEETLNTRKLPQCIDYSEG